jgi:hypothetical protein
MHPQLREIEDEFRSAGERLHRLAERVPAERWSERPAPGSWSVAECVEHLNLTSRAVLPRVREAVEQLRREGGAAPARFRRGFLGWLIWRASQPTTRMKSKTGPEFDPPSTPPPAELVAEFDRLQEEQLAVLRSADGLPLQRVKVASPFGPISYNAFAALSILSVHQLRHLLQAERVWEKLGGG